MIADCENLKVKEETEFRLGRIMKNNAVYNIKDVLRSVQTGQSLVDKGLGIPASSKMCGGIADLSLMIPETVTLFVAPLACCRHVTTHRWQRTDRMFALAIEEIEVVNGTHLDKIRQAVLEIYEYCKVKPKMIVICGSCIDRLAASDLEYVARDLKKKITAEIIVTWEDPVACRQEPPQVRCWKKLMSIWDHCNEKTNLAVNLIGRLYPPTDTSDLRWLLEKAGVKHVRYMTDCKTFDEYCSMGHASLNIVGEELSVKVARDLEREYQIPYITALPTFDIDAVHQMYHSVGEMLGINIHDEEIYKKTKQEIHEFRERRKHQPITMAVGETFVGSVNGFHIARDILKLGIDVQYIYSDGMLAKKEDEITWIAGNHPDTQVVFTNSAFSREVLLDPPKVDVAWGMGEKWFLHKRDCWIDSEKRAIYCDYESILWFMKEVEANKNEESF